MYHGFPISSIYVCPKGRALGGPQFRYAMIHALAHYVSDDGVIPDIDDVAYFHSNRGKYERMSNRQAMANADSYARFAFACVQPGEFQFP